mmetsp:Transcript_30384/g.87001  ORF Transcript_30384/g.87001 Transcript_30384/m.87001 type:complete len:859 (-) Transcript_30384:222-2798(-)
MPSKTFKVTVPDVALEQLLACNTWAPSKNRCLWQYVRQHPLVEALLRKLLIRGSRAAGEVLIPLSCVLSRYDDENSSCSLHSHIFAQLTLVVGATRPMLIGDSAVVLHEGQALQIDAGVPHGIPEQHSTCGPRVSINLFVATQAQVGSPPLSACLLAGRRPLEPAPQLCAFRWARPVTLDEALRPTDDLLFDHWRACSEALDGEQLPPRKRAKHAVGVPAELPTEWGVDTKVALDFAGLCAGAREVCLQRLQRVVDDREKVNDLNSYCSSVIKGVGDTFGAELQPQLREALNFKLKGSGWTLADLDSSAVGALAGLPRHSAAEIVSSLNSATVGNLSAFMTGCAKWHHTSCPLARALQSGWDAVVKVLAGCKAEVHSQALVQAIQMACEQHTLEAFEVACSALLLFPPGCTPPLSTYNSLFKAAGRVGRWPKALDLFNKLPEILQPNRYTYTALLDAVVHGGGPQTMLFALWNDMQRTGVAADPQLFSTMLQGCSDAAVADELLGDMDWQGIVPNREVLTSLVGCYRRAGAPTAKAWEALKLAKCCGLALDCQFFVSLVIALGFANDTGAVVLLVQSLRDVYKVKPDVFFYTAAIAQCARAGDMAGAETIISQMQRDGVEPNEHTHCAIIAAYSKAGHLKKAVEYFDLTNKEMALPIEAYCSILSGCRAVLDNTCALRILKKARQLGPVKSACYTLTRQCCAMAGDDDGAAKADTWQKRDGVPTHIPTSTVDDPLTGEPIAFQPGNDDESVAASVKTMMACVKSAGYDPRLWQYDPQISPEEREERLKYHTEKKALAWALQHFPQGSSITVRKTIRCCVDCHNTFKVASSAYGRTLRILDQVRMHEFTAGKCSCGDWW